MLLEAGADPNVEYFDGGAPLIAAVHNGDSEMVRLLLEAGADPNSKTRSRSDHLGRPLDGVDILVEIVIANRGLTDALEKIRLLLEAGADPNAKAASDPHARNNVPILARIYTDSYTKSSNELLRLLVEAGANPNPCLRCWGWGG